MNWMMKRIKKGNKTHIVAFCPTCTIGDPWTIHGQMEYKLLQIATAKKQEMLTQQKSTVPWKAGLKCPKKVPSTTKMTGAY
jgi:hypothetical protein